MANTDFNNHHFHEPILTPSSSLEGVMPIWEYLQTQDRPIVLYGTGNGADKILDQLLAHNITVAGVFASSDFVRDRSFRGFKVETYEALRTRLGHMIVLVCFGTSRPEVLANIDRIANECEVLAPDVPVYGSQLFDRNFYLAHEEELRQVYDLLSDDLSRQTFASVIDYKLTGDYRLLRPCEQPLDDNCGLLLDSIYSDGCFVDLGAYTGDTVEYYSSCFPCDISEVIAVEPDARNFRKLQNTAGRLMTTPRMIPGSTPFPETPLSISCVRALISDHDGTVSIDRNKGRGVHERADQEGMESIQATTLVTLLQDRKASFIKMDVEGNELLALLGGREIITRDKPALIVSCYHRSEDLFTLPLLLKELVPDYKIYMRHHPHLLCWDTEFILAV